MQQFSFNPAPFNQFNKYLIIIYILYKGMSGFNDKPEGLRILRIYFAFVDFQSIFQ